MHVQTATTIDVLVIATCIIDSYNLYVVHIVAHCKMTAGTMSKSRCSASQTDVADANWQQNLRSESHDLNMDISTASTSVKCLLHADKPKVKASNANIGGLYNR